MKRTLIASLVGTAAMTAYSYWRAYRQNTQFEEPQLLGKMIYRLEPEKVPKEYIVETGWIAHLGVGFMLTLIYSLRWRKKNPGLVEGVKVGLPTGLVALTWWSAVLKFHPKPPQTNLSEYRKHLILAHLIFGVATAWAYPRKELKKR